MRNKGLIIALTIVVSVLCAYFLFFTYISRQVQDKAVAYATHNGQVNETQRQHYLDSVWRAPVFGSYTYRDVKQSELGLGLDLKGGMHVTLEVSPVEIVRAMANNSKDPSFNKAIALAQERQKTSSGTAFTTLFAQAYQETAPGKPLARLFANSVNKDRGIDLNTSDNKVLAAINKEEEDAIGRSFDILRKRVDKFGVNQPNIQRVKGTGRIQVELPGVDNPDRVRKLLQGQAKLEFYEVWPQQEVLPYLSQLDQILGAKEKAASPTAKADSMIAAASAAKGDASSLAAQLAKKTPAAKATADSAKAQQGGPLTRLLVPAPGGLLVALRDTAQLNRLLRSPEALATLPPTMALLYEKKIQEGGTSPQAAKQQYLPLLAVRKDRTGNIAAPVSGEVVSDARQDYDQSGRPEVSLTMNPNGTRKWAKMTAANIGKQVAVVLDDVVYSAPVVQTEITGGQTQISGNFTVDEAQELAQVLKAGKLPAPTRIVEEAVVGPSLGQEAINQGLYSSLAGLLIIMAFMAVYYGRAGLVADAALLFNMFLVLGVLAQFGTALTLPGIAGLILVIASSVDANVLIFERIREELDHGVPLHDAVNAGYKRAFSAIFDSNVTTFIIGLLLFFFGTGPVQNFAITLLIGIFTSFLSAVYVSRLIIEFLIKGKETSAITFSTFLSRNLFKNVNFDIVGKRKIAYAVSTAIIVLGFVLMYVQGGPNLGVDFQGGRSYIVNFNKPMVASEVRDQLLPAFKGAGLEVKQYGQPSRLSVTTGYLATDESQDADKQVRASLDQGLDKFAADKPTVLSTSKVGATIADDIKRTSVLSLALTLAGIFLYVLLRFEKWQYSLAAVVALFHDALLVIASYPIAAALGLKYEMDQIFVAAVLTVIGFSMNDTVVIYDRIREYLRNNPKLTFAQVANPALNSTFSRTMITFTTVFLVVLVLYIFGGETLRSFSFAMMVGIVFGTYSSLFIATPIILDTYGKKEEAERRAAGEDLSTVPGNAPRLDTATA